MFPQRKKIVLRAAGFLIPLSTHARHLHRSSYRKSVQDLEVKIWNPQKPVRASNVCCRMGDEGSTITTVHVGGYKFSGISIAALQTCICVPSLSLAFDAGKAPSVATPMRYMAITHGHCDHVHGLPLHVATRSLQKLPPATYFVPAEIEADVRNLVDAVGQLECCSLDPHLVPLTPGCDGVELKKGWLLKAFRTQHSVPSLGYIVYKRKKKLKKTFAGSSASDLAQMRKAGIELDDVYFVPEIAFTGDTTLDAIAQSDDCRKARILITELTFLDNTCSAQKARRFGHIHIEEVIERANIFNQNMHVIFTHFSARYSREDVLSAMSRLPNALRNKSVAFGVSSVTQDSEACPQRNMKPE